MFYNNRPQIKLGKNWSFDKWGLLLASGWSLDAAKPKTSYVEIPAADGSIDLSEALAGEPRYQNRPLKFALVFLQPEPEWENLRRTVENYCNGQRMKIVLPHDTTHYLMGRISVGNLQRGAGSATLDIEAVCDPWRYRTKPTVMNYTIDSTGEATGVLRNERRRVIPTISTSGAVSVTINDITQSISAGTHKFTDFLLSPGSTPITITGAEGTTVTVEYQEASL